MADKVESADFREPCSPDKSHWVPCAPLPNGLVLHRRDLAKLAEKAAKKKLNDQAARVKIKIVRVVRNKRMASIIMKMRMDAPIGGLIETWCDLNHVLEEAAHFHTVFGRTKKVLKSTSEETPRLLGWQPTPEDQCEPDIVVKAEILGWWHRGAPDPFDDDDFTTHHRHQHLEEDSASASTQLPSNDSRSVGSVGDWSELDSAFDAFDSLSRASDAELDGQGVAMRRSKSSRLSWQELMKRHPNSSSSKETAKPLDRPPRPQGSNHTRPSRPRWQDLVAAAKANRTSAPCA
mmetsp:Transcript_66962/g.160384  ORF Transcript_66962/g.160384 Transcript_66962/m.160384 type:complete len:291 (+) Transcript_66962:106-978(+)